MNNTKFRLRSMMIALLTVSLVLTTACSQRLGITPDEQEPVSPLDTKNLHNRIDNHYYLLSQQRDSISIPIEKHEEKEYVSLNRIIEVLQFNKELDSKEQSISIGDDDVAIKLFFNVNQMQKEEQAIALNDSPIVINGKPMLPTTLISTVFRDEMEYHLAQNELIIYANGTTLTRQDKNSDYNVQDEALDFGEDPNDPLKDVDLEAMLLDDNANEDKAAIPAAKLEDVNIPKMISFGKKYLGVKYEFGADPYATSKRFDCSSFTKHVYKKHGVKLRRISRNQAKQGVAVSRKSLRKGDLMFFYVPGRFKSNKIVGHVGIYIGNKKMLHSSPEPKDGVQITNINKAFWKETYLKSRRIVK